ncbi:MAG: helicase [Acidimicrobiia bacterium]|nr:helicase [Acidimicrobiia bacterium]MYG57530.1 helicase [Acidimicrobiia bacterium]MYJ34290.1 helicase [Acidimicrobiia bacterium]
MQHIDVQAVLADLKEFQRQTARWAFERMFDEKDPAIRFLVADEVGLGKTHVAKGVIAQVIDHLQDIGDERHDIVYVCSNGAIARQNIRKLVPKGIQPLEDVERLTMLSLAELNDGDGMETGINLLAITPGTSLKFGRNTGQFRERCLAYTYLRAYWGASVMTAPARRIFWEGVSTGGPDARLRGEERLYRPRIRGSLKQFGEVLADVDRSRRHHGRPTIRELFDELADGLAWKRTFPDNLKDRRKELIGEVRRIMAIVGIAALRPDLVVLDEFQRFKDLLTSNTAKFAAELAHRLFDHRDPDTGRATRTLLLSATPYRMYSTADEIDSDHYADFFDTCSFLFQDAARVDRLKNRFGALRLALISTESAGDAEAICRDIATELRTVMARTERLAATPDRDGMLKVQNTLVQVEPVDLRAYLRTGDIAEAVDHHEPTEYWKSGPYLVNFMESYKLKEAILWAAEDGTLNASKGLKPGPGLLGWDDVEAYRQIDPQNGRLRWLLEDLDSHHAFELLWIPPSMRYYEAGSVYETPEASRFTKRLIFSGWTVVPKVVSSMVSYEAERRAYAERSHGYTADYGRRGGQRLSFRTDDRTADQARPGDLAGGRRAATMTAFLLVWPSPSLSELGDPRSLLQGRRIPSSELLSVVRGQVEEAIAPLLHSAPATGPIDQRWYWAAPLFLDQERHPSAANRLLDLHQADHWNNEPPGEGLRAHLEQAVAMADSGTQVLGRPPDNLAEVLAELAVGGPGQCALRAMSSVTGLPLSHHHLLLRAARVGNAFRTFFNAPEVTAIIGRHQGQTDNSDSEGRYWRDVLLHSIGGHLQAVLDEHAHILKDWLGYLTLDDDDKRIGAADDISSAIVESLELRTSLFRVDIPRQEQNGDGIQLDEHRMRTRFAVAFGNQTLDEGGEARIESVSRAFNSPFWPFVLTSTSIGQEGLDFHLWCHAVVHWNLPSNPVDMEQREGRVHRYKGHAVRRNIAASLGQELLAQGPAADEDLWSELFALAVAKYPEAEGEMVPYWVFPQGPAKIERHVPVLPFSRDEAALPQLHKALAAYRLAFGQARQEELVEFLGADRSDEELLLLASRLRIDLSPPISGAIA